MDAYREDEDASGDAEELLAGDGSARAAADAHVARIEAALDKIALPTARVLARNYHLRIDDLYWPTLGASNESWISGARVVHIVLFVAHLALLATSLALFLVRRATFDTGTLVPLVYLPEGQTLTLLGCFSYTYLLFGVQGVAVLFHFLFAFVVALRRWFLRFGNDHWPWIEYFFATNVLVSTVAFIAGLHELHLHLALYALGLGAACAFIAFERLNSAALNTGYWAVLPGQREHQAQIEHNHLAALVDFPTGHALQRWPLLVASGLLGFQWLFVTWAFGETIVAHGVENTPVLAFVLVSGLFVLTLLPCALALLHAQPTGYTEKRWAHLARALGYFRTPTGYHVGKVLLSAAANVFVVLCVFVGVYINGSVHAPNVC